MGLRGNRLSYSFQKTFRPVYQSVIHCGPLSMDPLQYTNVNFVTLGCVGEGVFFLFCP